MSKPVELLDDAIEKMLKGYRGQKFPEGASPEMYREISTAFRAGAVSLYKLILNLQADPDEVNVQKLHKQMVEMSEKVDGQVNNNAGGSRNAKPNES